MGATGAGRCAAVYWVSVKFVVVSGKVGGSAGWPWKRKAEVRSPKVCLRQALMFGHLTPVTFSRNISCDV